MSISSLPCALFRFVFGASRLGSGAEDPGALLRRQEGGETAREIARALELDEAEVRRRLLEEVRARGRARPPQPSVRPPSLPGTR